MLKVKWRRLDAGNWEFDYIGPVTDNSDIKVSIDLDITGSGGFGIAGNASALSLDVDQAAAQLTRSGTSWTTSTVTYSFFYLIRASFIQSGSRWFG